LAKTIPKPSIFDNLEFVGFISGAKRWRSHGGRRLYTWDALHGEVEVFNGRGRHLGVLDVRTGHQIKPAIKGRSIDV
jgi:Cytotoxic